jgi:hypothetical protein
VGSTGSDGLMLSCFIGSCLDILLGNPVTIFFIFTSYVLRSHGELRNDSARCI